MKGKLIPVFVALALAASVSSVGGTTTDSTEAPPSTDTTTDSSTTPETNPGFHPAAEAEDFTAAKSQIFDAINHLRKCHNANAPDLRRDPGLDNLATTRVLQWSKTGRLGPGPPPESGLKENSYSQPNGPRIRQNEPIRTWYCTCSKTYNYNLENNPPGCDSFTNLLWKQTVAVGLGIARGERDTFLIAEFARPPSNPSFRQNIGRPNDSCINAIPNLHNLCA